MKRLLSALPAIALAACASTKCPPSTGVPEPVAAAVPSLGLERRVTARVSPGFYRHADEPTVYRVGSNGSACVILSVQQMAAYGGFSRVKIVPHAVDFLGAKVAPPCPWPASR